MTKHQSGIVTLHYPIDMSRWFGRHPILAERATLALCRHMAAVRTDVDLTSPGVWLEWIRGVRVDHAAHSRAWRTWKAAGALEPDRPDRKHFRLNTWTRDPPLPFGSLLYGDDDWPPNTCPVCRCSTYAGGDWRETAGKARWNKNWHGCCFQAHAVWRDPWWVASFLANRQGGVCPLTGETLNPDGKGWRGEIDHTVPLWRVRYDAQQHRWPDVLLFWGWRNLQLLSFAGHKIKTKREAQERAALAKSAAPAQLSLLEAQAGGSAVDAGHRKGRSA